MFIFIYGKSCVCHIQHAVNLSFNMPALLVHLRFSICSAYSLLASLTCPYMMSQVCLGCSGRCCQHKLALLCSLCSRRVAVDVSTYSSPFHFSGTKAYAFFPAFSSMPGGSKSGMHLVTVLSRPGPYDTQPASSSSQAGVSAFFCAP